MHTLTRPVTPNPLLLAFGRRLSGPQLTAGQVQAAVDAVAAGVEMRDAEGTVGCVLGSVWSSPRGMDLGQDGAARGGGG